VATTTVHFGRRSGQLHFPAAAACVGIHASLQEQHARAVVASRSQKTHRLNRLEQPLPKNTFRGLVKPRQSRQRHTRAPDCDSVWHFAEESRAGWLAAASAIHEDSAGASGLHFSHLHV
jgi:hypothetical protein